MIEFVIEVVLVVTIQILRCKDTTISCFLKIYLASFPENLKIQGKLLFRLHNLTH